MGCSAPARSGMAACGELDVIAQGADPGTSHTGVIQSGRGIMPKYQPAARTASTISHHPFSHSWPSFTKRHP